LVPLAFRKQFQGLHDGKTGSDEGEKLLIEYYELFQRNAAPSRQPKLSAGDQS
jgi:hypothetical protein